MLNSIVRFLFKKEIILYNRHRQTIPIINEAWNREHFIFFEIIFLWRLIPFSSKSKYKFRIMYGLLNLISPKFILDVNWISSWHSLYYLWCKKNSTSKFIVVQHGLYAAGVITDVAHRYSKCQIMLCWGAYFKELFESYNSGKRARFIIFGNTIYNREHRSFFQYVPTFTGNILLVPTGIKRERLEVLTRFKDKLEGLGFNVFLKEHNLQTRFFGKIDGFNKIQGDIYSILSEKNYDIVISDHSSCLLDAIYYKNNVLFFSPLLEDEYYYNNIYSDFLPNLALGYASMKSKNELYAFVDTKAQENLYQHLVSEGDNSLLKLQQ
jgi:hypothetical protein